MTPRERMRAEYLARPEEETFEWYLDYHERNGVVLEGEGLFACGLACNKRQLSLGVHPFTARLAEDLDCWYVSMMAGDMRAALALLPYELPWIAWHRDPRRNGRKRSSYDESGKDLRFCETDSIRHLVVSLMTSK